MKTQLKRQSQEQGSVLVITLILGTLLLVTLSSYLMLIGSQKTLVSQSQSWNSALTMAEAGVEEAIAQISTSPTDFAANGWPAVGTTYGPMTRSLSGGSYSVSIVGTTLPTIFSTGYAAVAVSGAKISRVIKVTASSQGLINVAIAAKDNIRFNGNGVATDSWNSHDPNLSTGGQYDSNKTSTNGDVASVAGIVDIGQHTINGSLYLGPSATFTGSAAQVTDQIFTDYNVQFPDVVEPTSSWAGPVPNSGGLHDFAYSGDYLISDSKDIIVEPGAQVRIKVTATTFSPGNVTIKGGMTNSGTLTVYQVSGTGNLSGNVSVHSNRPENLWYYGEPGVTSITYGGSSSFVGVIYAPQADLTLNGGGNNIGVVGASITKTITLNGHYNFHYDESLATNGPARGFVIKSWQEL